jgi:hypothetical protein
MAGVVLKHQSNQSTSAGLRSFRHTCASAAFKIISAVAKLAHDLANNLDVNEKQTETENGKNKPNQARLHQFEKDRRHLLKQKESYEQLMTKLVDE